MSAALAVHPRVVGPAERSLAPIDRSAMAGNASQMNRHRTAPPDDTSALPAAAGLQDDASEPASGESVSRRYARAAASWPRDGVAPSYERQAQLLTALHDAGATLRAGAECCRRARDILASTIA